MGELGLISLNRTVSKKIEPVALVTRGKMIDGTFREPFGVSHHDIVHIKTGRGEEQFYDRLEKKRENLSVEEGKNVELAYHLLTHETSRKTTLIDSSENIIENDIRKGLLDLIRFASQDSRGLRGVINLTGPSDPQIQVIIGDFMKIFREIRGELVQH